MATLGMNDVKTGQKILVNNDPCIIIDTEYVKPGKGQAFTNLFSGARLYVDPTSAAKRQADQWRRSRPQSLRVSGTRRR